MVAKITKEEQRKRTRITTASGGPVLVLKQKDLPVLLIVVLFVLAGYFYNKVRKLENLQEEREQIRGQSTILEIAPTSTPTPAPVIKRKTVNPPPSTSTPLTPTPIPATPKVDYSLAPVALKSGITVYCKPEGIEAVKDADNAYHEGLQKYESCAEEARRYTGEQLTACNKECRDFYSSFLSSCQDNMDCQHYQQNQEDCLDLCKKTYSDINLVKSCEAYYSLQRLNLEDLKKTYCK